MNTLTNVIFDLDGTLIDSAPGILASFAATLGEHHIEPGRRLDASLIGPPLFETMRLLSGLDDPAQILPLVESFKRHYDGAAVRQTPAYPGIAELLAELNTRGLTLHIATNKRLAPTTAILDHLGLSRHFSSIYALDMRKPRYPDKSTLIGALLVERRIAGREVVYVGDKSEDGVAANANDLPFIAATWGYGDFDAGSVPVHWRFAESPLALRDVLISAI